MSFIIAVDYDGTLFEGSFPELGAPKRDVIDKVMRFKKHGAEIVLWTCRESGSLDEAIDRCNEEGLIFDAINSNAPSQIEYMQKMLEKGEVFATKKIYADIYVDDRAPGSIDFFLSIDVEKTCENYEDRSEKA